MDHQRFKSEARALDRACAAIARRASNEGRRVTPQELATIRGNIAKKETMMQGEFYVNTSGSARAWEPSSARSTGRSSLVTDRQGIESWRSFVHGEKRASMTTSDSAGGYLVPEPVHKAMIDLAFKVSPIAAEATLYNMSGPAKIELPIKSKHAAVGWVAETALRPETDAPEFANATLEAFELYGMTAASQQVLDSVRDGEEMILTDLSGSLWQELNTKFCAGDGNGTPTGIWSAAGIATYQTALTGSQNAVDAAGLFAAMFKLPTAYMGNAKWYMKPATLAQVAQLQYPNAVARPMVDWSGDTAMILGKPVVLVDDAPAIGDGAFPIAFGDMRKAYAVGVHKDITVLRDPYSNKPFVDFYGLARVGGVPTDPAALVLLKSDPA